jgi:hypothetical protein
MNEEESPMDKLYSKLTYARPWVLAAVAAFAILLLLATGAQTASADTGTPNTACIRDATGFDQGTICTANDVRISTATVIGGATSCTAGETVSIRVRAKIESGPDRYDIGIWVDQLGGDAMSFGGAPPLLPVNRCYRDFLEPMSLLNNTDVNLSGGAGPYFNAEPTTPQVDLCGDVPALNEVTDSDKGPCTYGGGTCVYNYHDFTVNITCHDSNADLVADTGFCTSWDQSKDTVPACTNELQTNPGNSSKCGCESLPVINLKVLPSIDVKKYVSVDNQATWDDAQTAPGPWVKVGNPVYFKYVVTNTGDAMLSPVRLTDNVYSTGTCTVPASLAPGASFECIIGSFAAAAGVHTNIATAEGDYLTETASDTDPANYNGDGTPPTCRLTATRAGPPKQIDVTVQDTGSGLASVVVTVANNLTAAWAPPWAPGATFPVIYTATKINQALGAQFGLRITDVAGNVTVCDPVDLTVGRDTGKPTTATVTGVPQAESKITITNGTPGLTNLRITVNGRQFQAAGLKAGEVRELDVAWAMMAGDDNTISFMGLGKPTDSAWILVHD